MPRSIDHLVLAVPDLAAAMGLYRAMGFTVGARNRHPWGTENAVVQLDGAFLELIGLGEGFALPPPLDPAEPFARLVAAAVIRGGGLALVALDSIDADADAAAFTAAGLGPRRRLDFVRSAEAPDGTRRTVSFSLAFADVAALPEAAFFTCRHHHPENFWSAAARRHPNGASRLDAVVLATDAVDACGAAVEVLLRPGPDGATSGQGLDVPTGRIDVLTAPETEARYGGGSVPGRFAAYAVLVASLDPVRTRLDAAAIPHAEIDGALVVPPGAAFGVALAFVPAPCHSRA